ncbi:winged helix-turn-helix transcriptional regulator [Nocardia callitridis]|uniref:Helix-turn-helix domain-containing protein n=1 Tax=Nocardia callitridis TaxID=648753 RepID=A0ABP9KU14_9NOCA
MPRRSHDHYCAVSRALDVVGDRWSLLLVRELSSGPRRYSDLFADLPGISTDILAARLKDLERDAILTKRKVGARASTVVYELTDAGSALRPVLDSLSEWGTPLLGQRRPTDAIRAHWFALPIGRALAQQVSACTVEVHVSDNVFHVVIDAARTVTHHDGPAAEPDHRLHLDLDTAIGVVNGAVTLPDAHPVDHAAKT